MLDRDRSKTKVYTDLVANFISSLTKLVLLRRDAYLRHAHPNLDAFTLSNHLRRWSVQQNLDARVQTASHWLGVKPGWSSKKDRFHPYKKQKGRGGHQCHHLRASTINQCRHPITWCNSPFSPIPIRVVTEEVDAVAGDAAVGVTLAVASSNNLLNDTYQTVLPSRKPGQRPTTVSDNL